MALIQEDMTDTLTRADNSVRFTATEGEENGPYQWDRFYLWTRNAKWQATSMTVEGATITLNFQVEVGMHDTVEVPL